MSDGLTVQVEGMAEVRHMLNNVKKIDLRQPMNDATAQLLKDARVYPPTMPKQKYIRTYMLRAGWERKVSGSKGNLTGDVYNYRTPYGQWVQHPLWQAMIHRGRWRTTTQIMQMRQAKIFALFDAYIKRMTGK